MCGFAGVFSFSEQALDQIDEVGRMTALVARRGPDDAGHWNDDRVALGFRRLAILDPTEAGHQPMESADGRMVLVFNGEVYNYREIRRDLERNSRVHFRSGSDTEVVLMAFSTWGERALERFNGMFALALYDRLERSLLLARDPLGIKPLYYLTDHRGVVFGSQYDQLLRHPWCDNSEVSLDVLGLYLRFGYVPSPYGLIKSTFQVPAGHTINIRPGSVSLPRPFRVFPTRPSTYLTRPELDEQLPEILRGALGRQLRSDVGVGTFLSGGIDSPLVSAEASRLRTDLPAFTIGSLSQTFDETEDATRYANAIGCEHIVREISEIDALGIIDDVVAAYAEPFADYSAFPTLLVSKMAREHVSVVLSGDGGDELFWGYPRMWSALAARRFHRLPRRARQLAYKALRGRPSRPELGATMFESIGSWYEHKHGAVEMLNFAPSLPDAPDDFALYDSARVAGADSLAQWLRSVEVRGHLEKVLMKVDRASMFHSLEVRVPLLDLELVDFATQIDPLDCLGDGIGKIPLRRHVQRLLPSVDIPVPKRGFEVPLGDWFRGALRDVFQERVLEDPIFMPHVWDLDLIRSTFDRHLDGTVESTQKLWTLLSLQLWADRHIDQSAT